MENIKCVNEGQCFTGLWDHEKCLKCANNTKRNSVKDFFVEANDDQIPLNAISVLSAFPYAIPVSNFKGEIEGYECPVCHKITTTKAIIRNSCRYCGFYLLIKKVKKEI